MAPVQEVDFLPIEYRQQDARRQVQPWRIVVVVAFALMLTAAAFTQFRHRRCVESELNAVQPYYEEAGRLKSRLAEFQAKLQTVESDAGLLTYLRCPWPRTQLLTVLLAPLPAEIGLYQVQVTTEMPPEQPVAETRSQADRKADEEKLRKAPPSCRDLKRLREEFDKAQTLVRIAGTTRDTGALYRYLGVLGKTNLFAKVDLRSVESMETPEGVSLRFQAVLAVRPGYGQPGGPEGKTEGQPEGTRSKTEVGNAKSAAVRPSVSSVVPSLSALPCDERALQ